MRASAIGHRKATVTTATPTTATPTTATQQQQHTHNSNTNNSLACASEWPFCAGLLLPPPDRGACSKVAFKILPSQVPILLSFPAVFLVPVLFLGRPYPPTSFRYMTKVFAFTSVVSNSRPAGPKSSRYPLARKLVLGQKGSLEPESFSRSHLALSGLLYLEGSIHEASNLCEF